MGPGYLPVAERRPDSQYAGMVARILAQGQVVATRTGTHARTLMQQTMHYPIGNGFPLITDRSLASFWRKPIGELCAFINGATTLAELEAFGCDWWAPWATPEMCEPLGLDDGDIGPGSYGGAFRRFPTVDRATGWALEFDQLAHLVAQIREHPHLRTHVVSPWIPAWNARAAGLVPATTLSPCHGWVHVRVMPDGLHLHMWQRSGDVPVGVPANMVQYGALLLMLAHLTGHRPAGFYHTISDAHIYLDQSEYMHGLLRTVTEKWPRTLPTVTLNDAGRQVTDIHGFRAEHFDLADYNPHPPIRDIPVGV